MPELVQYGFGKAGRAVAAKANAMTENRDTAGYVANRRNERVSTIRTQGSVVVEGLEAVLSEVPLGATHMCAAMGERQAELAVFDIGRASNGVKERTDANKPRMS